MTTLDDTNIGKAFYYILANSFLVIVPNFPPLMSGTIHFSASSLAVNFLIFKSADFGR